jgi:hypothetical protein
MEKDPTPTDAAPDTSRRDRLPLSPQSLKHVVTSIERTRSRHTTLGRYYMQRALLILFEPSDAGAEWVPREPEFAYFLTPDSRRTWETILGELGRMPDDETVRTVARMVGQEQPPTQKAVALIRRLRGSEPGPRPRRLEERLLAAIDEHWARYPATSATDILTALSTAAGIIRLARPARTDDDAGS